jgi:small subunit ribosomal protein S15
VLVRPEELAHDAPAQRISLPLPADEADVSVPPSLAFGLRGREQRMLFEHLPLLSADMRTRREMTMVGTWQRWGDAGAGADVGDGQKRDAEGMAAFHEMELVAGVAQANALARVVDLRNANAAGVAFENRRRVVEAFSEPGKPNDTGRTEVQGTLLCSTLFFNPSDFFGALLHLLFSCAADTSNTECLEPPPGI